MILADTMLGFFIILAVLISYNAIWLLCRALWGDLVRHALDAHHDGMVKSFFLGLPMTAFLLVVGLALLDKKMGPWGLVGLATLSFYFMFASIGMAGIAALVGEKLGCTSNEAVWKQSLRGGCVLSFSFLFPIVGWFAIMPIAFITGCGATIRACFRSRKSRLACRVAAPPVSVPAGNGE